LDLGLDDVEEDFGPVVEIPVGSGLGSGFGVEGLELRKFRVEEV